MPCMANQRSGRRQNRAQLWARSSPGPRRRPGGSGRRRRHAGSRSRRLIGRRGGWPPRRRGHSDGGHHLGAATQLLDVQVDQVAGPRVLIAADRPTAGAVQPGQAVHPVTDQDAVHGRGRQAKPSGDAGRAEPLAPAQPEDALLKWAGFVWGCGQGCWAGRPGQPGRAAGSGPTSGRRWCERRPSHERCGRSAVAVGQRDPPDRTSLSAGVSRALA